MTIPLSTLRVEVLAGLSRLPPNVRDGYTSDRLLDVIRVNATPAVYDALSRANAVTRASLEASIDKANQERQKWIVSGAHRARSKHRPRVRRSKKTEK